MQTTMYGWDNQSQPVFTASITHPGMFWDYPKKLLKTADNQLLLFGNVMKSCDVGGWRDYIVKIDTTGVVLFHTYIQASNTPFVNGEIRDAVAYPDGSFYLVSADTLFHYSSSGQTLSKVSAGMTNITSLALLANGNLLLNGLVNGILKNVELSITASILNQQTCNSVITKFVQTASGSLVGRTSAFGLELYNSSLSLITASASVNLPGAVNDLVTRNDSLFITGYTPANPFYAILSPSFTTLYQTQSSYKGIVPSGIAINNKNNISIISTCASSVQQNVTFKGYYHMPLTGSFVSISDVGVSSYSLTSFNYWLQGYGPVQYEVYPVYDFNIKVKNHSATDTIHNFYLNYFIPQFGCDRLFHNKYTVTIPPLDSLAVPTGTFYGAKLIVPANTQPSDIFYQKLCFFTTVPNGSNDIEINNDANCDSVMITNLALEIQKNEQSSFRAAIFPSPFSNQLMVDSEVEIQRLQVCNMLGSLVYEEAPLSNKVELDLPDLPLGVYLLKLQTEKGALIKKVVKN